MCGITGIYSHNTLGRLFMINLVRATDAISSRGPDFQGVFNDEVVGMGHRRLSVIDPSPAGNQPMKDETERYILVYNGEIYNYKSLRSRLQKSGVQFHSESDTEVLLHLLIHEGIGCLNKVNGFFAFAFYDRQEECLLLVRDRYGIKPLFYYYDEDKFLFSSEMKSIFMYGIDKKPDIESLKLYLQLNYIPAPYSMLHNVKKLEPGHFLRIKGNNVEKKSYYDLKKIKMPVIPGDYEGQKQRFEELLEQSVTDRLVSDVPLGTFLSGGIDSSVISALAARHTDKLHTFSIGFRDEPFFDETKYARQVAAHIGSEHTVFRLSDEDLYAHVFDILDYLDEPFADSSAIAVYILSRETRKHVTVALSGDGADELLGGYNKHTAVYRMLHPGFIEKWLVGLAPVWSKLPQSRNNFLTDKFRQFDRFARNYHLSPKERYWSLATFMNEDQVSQLLASSPGADLPDAARKEIYLDWINDHHESLGDSLLTDLRLVLPNDMLTKVDLMSMANGLEIRVPFLDHRVVEFLISLPDDCKIKGNYRKRILRDTFRGILPRKITNRTKQGFEVPLLKWFRSGMKTLINEELLDDDYIRAQGIFNPSGIKTLKKKLFSAYPGDVHATIWALVVFQWWYRKWIEV